MDRIFVNSENSKTSYPHRLSLNLSDEINLKMSNKYVALSKTYYMEKYKRFTEKQ